MFGKRPVAAFLMTLACAAGAAADDIADIAGAVAAAGHDVPAVSVLRNACDTDPLCVARFLKDRIGGVATLVPQDVGAQKPSGWQQSPALHYVLNDTKGRLIIVPARYDVAAFAKAIEAAGGDGAPVEKLVIDIRRMDDDSNLDGMRRLVAAFIGRQNRAFHLVYSTGRAVDWTVPAPLRRLGTYTLEIWTDADIGATEEAFAALLRVHAGATVLGEASRARGILVQSIPVVPGWALIVPTGQLSVAGDVLTDGLIPDGPLPAQ